MPLPGGGEPGGGAGDGVGEPAACGAPPICSAAEVTSRCCSSQAREASPTLRGTTSITASPAPAPGRRRPASGRTTGRRARAGRLGVRHPDQEVVAPTRQSLGRAGDAAYPPATRLQPVSQPHEPTEPVVDAGRSPRGSDHRAHVRSVAQADPRLVGLRTRHEPPEAVIRPDTRSSVAATCASSTGSGCRVGRSGGNSTMSTSGRRRLRAAKNGSRIGMECGWSSMSLRLPEPGMLGNRSPDTCGTPVPGDRFCSFLSIFDRMLTRPRGSGRD